MGDSIGATLKIGGPIPRSLRAELLEKIRAEEEFEGEDENVLDDEFIELTGSPNNGDFEIEQWLQDHGIGYDKHTDALSSHGFEASNQYFRPGQPTVETAANQGGLPLLEFQDLDPVLALMEQGSFREAHLALKKLTSLPPLEPISWVGRRKK